MKVQGLDGRTHNWDLRGHVPLGSEEKGSSGHEACRELLERLFPADRRHEEVTLPGSDGLRADFVLVSKRLIVEVHGRQHYEYVQHFHKDRLGYLRHRQRDENKREWCRINNFVYCELPDDKPAEWTDRIRAALCGTDG